MKKSTTPIHAKRIAIAVAAVCASLSMPAVANENKAMLDLMLKKGVITQKDYNDFMEANKEADENKAFKDFRTDKDVSTSIKDIQKRQNDGSVKENGFGFKSKDGNSELNITGRLHFDARAVSGDWGNYTDRDSSSMSDRFSARRARIGATGVFNKSINYEIVTNLVGSNANLLDTAWANYTVKPEAQWRIGRFKQPYGLETLQSSNNIGFMERSYQDQISPGKQLGAMFHGELPNSVTYAASVYQSGYDQLSSTGGFEMAARATVNLAKTLQGLGDDAVLHFGVAATGGTFQILPTASSQGGSTTETKGAFLAFNDEFGGLRNVYRSRIFGTTARTSGGANAAWSGNGIPSYPASDTSSVKQMRAGLEAVFAKGPLKFQAEMSRIDLTASGKTMNSNAVTTPVDTRASGYADVYYLDLMYNLTGEPWAAAYRSGVVGTIRPSSPFDLSSMTGTGAWQVGLRYSAYDAVSFGLNDGSGSGGYGQEYSYGSATKGYEIEGSPTGNTVTLGVNWILNPNARIMFNYAESKFGYAFKPVDIGSSVAAAVAGDGSKAFMIRSQFNF
jgi:phosphate-selective porin OprO/OprP